MIPLEIIESNPQYEGGSAQQFPARKTFPICEITDNIIRFRDDVNVKGYNSWHFILNRYHKGNTEDSEFV